MLANQCTPSEPLITNQSLSSLWLMCETILCCILATGTTSLLVDWCWQAVVIGNRSCCVPSSAEYHPFRYQFSYTDAEPKRDHRGKQYSGSIGGAPTVSCTIYMKFGRQGLRETLVQITCYMLPGPHNMVSGPGLFWVPVSQTWAKSQYSPLPLALTPSP